MDGNLIFNVCLIKGFENILINSVSKNIKWVNYIFVLVGCVDVGNYMCVGSFEGFNISEKIFRINILCKYICIIFLINI